MKIAFIGGGKMAEAIITAVLQKKRVISSAITVADTDAERRQYSAPTYGVLTRADNVEAAFGQDVVVLAVKPQNMPAVLAGLQYRLHESQLVISIAAGVKIKSIVQALKHSVVIRAVPNMTAHVGMGVTGWTATPEVDLQQKERARTILGSMGTEIYFEDENALDMVTAVSGSGPAYVFLFVEALISAGENIGLSHKDASTLALQTLLGSAHLLEASGKNPAELRQAVTSKGGTTESALQVLENGGFRRLIADAVEAAWRRAGELGA